MSANERQVGGDHYKTKYEHWDWVENNGIGYLEGCASKYVSRWRKKNGVQDLEKALHYVEKLIELNRPNRINMMRSMEILHDTTNFCEVNELTKEETEIILSLSSWMNTVILSTTKHKIQRLIKHATPAVQA